MALYRKRPVVVEARQFTGDGNGLEIAEWCGGEFGRCPAGDHNVIDIPTLEGVMTASPGWWIIKGVAGEFYPCEPAIFEATYEEEPSA